MSTIGIWSERSAPRVHPERSPTEETEMKTRLTDVLGIDHPVMLAGMGGRVLRTAGHRGVRGRRVRLPRCLDHVHRADGGRDRRRPRGHRQAVRCRPAHGHARGPGGPGRTGHRGGRLGLRGRPRSPGRRGRALPPPRRPGHQHVREGGPCPTGPRRRMRRRGGPGHRGRGPHRAGGHHAARPPDRRRGGRPHPGGGGRRHLRRTRAWPPPWPSEPTGCGSAPGSSPPPRPGR